MVNGCVSFLITTAMCICASPAFAEDAARGTQVYTDSTSAMCHSVAGLGNNNGPLDGVGSKLSAAEIRQWITTAPDMAVKAKADRALHNLQTLKK